MKKILGLDLGVGSIGWAFIKENDTPTAEILGMGVRVIPLSIDDKSEFSSGNKISKNQQRTQKRTQRKGYDRYQLRRTNLKQVLSANGMLPERRLIELPSVQLFELRAKAVREKISLVELGRICLHLNQKRGYKSSRSDANLEKKDTEYVAVVKGRHAMLKEAGQTIGQHFFQALSANRFCQVKNQVFPREAYIEEFEAIFETQQKFHPELTPALINKLKNEIIYYQRKLKSQKGLVSVCEFEGQWQTTKENKEIFAGPRVAPKSSPLFQVCKIWESINNITLKSKKGEKFDIPVEKKQELFHYLDNHKSISQAELFKILGLKKDDGWYGNKQISKGIQGNIVKTAIVEALGIYANAGALLKFDLETAAFDEEVHLASRKSGEVSFSTVKKQITPGYEYEPLYQLWHIIYSLQDSTECENALVKRFDLPPDIAQKLAGIDFAKFSFGNKSARAIRKILPYLADGFVYSDACTLAGYNHSNSLTSEENIKRQLLNSLPLLPKNSLRQPVVEKILNQLINLVNALVDKYGKPDEIRIELARELKQSREERNETYLRINKQERENKGIIERIESEYRQLGVRATRNNIIKWRLFTEISEGDPKTNATCIYCGKLFGLADALRGANVDVEHIIPKSLLFDDSMANKTLSHQSCNQAKGNLTAYDYMKTMGDAAFNAYLERVGDLFSRKIIGKAKRDKLLMNGSEIPQNFIARQLRETQYISRKSIELLKQVCHNVFATSGSVTEYLRRVWGWDDVLMNLQLPQYRQLGQTEWKEWETHNGQKHKKEVITGWKKRNDHRHHAIDALVVACTKQGYIQRINTLSGEGTRDLMKAEIDQSGNKFDPRKSLIENYFFNLKPFQTAAIEEIAAQIFISLKPGKKAAATGKRKVKINQKKQVVQTGIIIPRGALSEESVYGKIKAIEKDKPVKYLFEHPDLIFKTRIKELVTKRLEENENDSKKAISSLKKNPLYVDADQTIPLTHGTCFKDEYVIKYPVQQIKAGDVKYIIDPHVRKVVAARLEAFGNKEKEAFKDLENNPIWFNEEKRIPVKTVRCYTGLNAVEPVKRDEQGNVIGYVKPGNNHHIAIYTGDDGSIHEHLCSFWHAVERKRNEFPAVIDHPRVVWDKILSGAKEYPESFKEKLPNDNWTIKLILMQNEYFILGLSDEDFQKAMDDKDYKTLGGFLYRVQKIASSDYWFRRHNETEIIDTEDAKAAKRFVRIQSIKALLKLNLRNVKISLAGDIVLA